MKKIRKLACELFFFTIFVMTFESWGDNTVYSEMIPKDGTVIEQKILNLDGKKGFAVLRDGEKINFGKRGLSASFVCRLRDNGEKYMSPEGLDIFLAKKNHFLFGRYGKFLYLNLSDGKKWVSPFLVPIIPPVGEWTHYVFVVEYRADEAQGDYEYIQRIYMNGELLGTGNGKNPDPPDTDEPILIGHMDNWLRNWLMNGEIAELQVVNRALARFEIDQLVSSSKFVKLKSVTTGELQSCSPIEKWAVELLSRLPENQFGDIQKQLQPGKIIEGLQKMSSQIGFFETSELMLMFSREIGTGHPVLGIFDKKAECAVTANSGFDWELEGQFKKQNNKIKCDELKYEIASESPTGLSVRWKQETPFPLEIVSEIKVGKIRVAAILSVDNQAPDFILRRVHFPICRLGKTDENDTLLFPFQCGALVKNPTENCFIYGQEGTYPSMRSTMQFDACYNGKRGVYVGMEDPRGFPKMHSVIGRKYLGLDIKWGHFIPISPDKTGGNGFSEKAEFVIELYDGEWFEAAQIYRRFLENKANWWIKELPRKDTPEWYRHGTLSFSIWPLSRQRGETEMRELLYLRKYFGLPILISWHNWYDRSKGQWPHFDNPYDYTLEILDVFNRNEIFTMPYIAPMLWAKKDGPSGKSDYQYSSTGKAYAVKNIDGTIPVYTYANTSSYDNGEFAIECPGAEGWRDFQYDLNANIIKYGFTSIYHDQIGTCPPRLCFDQNHGHLLNDPSVWLENGYLSLLKRIKKSFPEIPHSTEDFSEPYASVFDSAYPWRWTYANMVPVMQSLYCGRVQFSAKIFDMHQKGDGKDFYAKAAMNLVNGEWIACFAPWELAKADFRRIYIKKLMHLRLALVDYFNRGRMLAPLKFKEPISELQSRWGGFYPPPIVTTPKIISNSFQLQDTKLFIFINTVNEIIEFNPVTDFSNSTLFRCGESLSSAEKIQSDLKVKLLPYGYEIWIQGSLAEAQRIQMEIKRISTFFDPGINFTDLFQFPEHRKIKVIPGQFCSVETVSGVYNCSITEDNIINSFLPDALISFGEVDFGTIPVNRIQLKVEVSQVKQSRRFEILTGSCGNVTEVIGSSESFSSTGGVGNFKNFPVKLTRPLTGKNNLIIRYDGSSWGCSFAGWEILPDQ